MSETTYNIEASGWMSDKYYEMLMAVETKHPGESRHETALRYIREREGFTVEAKEEMPNNFYKKCFTRIFGDQGE